MAKKTKERIEMFTLVSIFLIALFSVVDVRADEMVHQFKNPSFSGIGTSAHYLTIENQEFSRKMTIKEELKAIQEQIERDKRKTKVVTTLIMIKFNHMGSHTDDDFTRQ